MRPKESLNENSALTLAFDTSGRVGSVAIGIGEKIELKETFTGQMKHSTELFTLISELLEQINKTPSDIDNVYFSYGPGSFTGLRIGVTLAKMMQLAKNNIKIVPVSTLEALAINADNEDCEKICTILDAKRGLFFFAGYEKQNGRWNSFIDEQLSTPEQILETIGNSSVSMLGEGLVYYKNRFDRPNISFLNEDLWTVRAENVYKLGLELAKKGQFANALELLPNYVRGHEAKVKSNLKK